MFRRFSFFACILSAMGWTSTAFAMECQSDDDCADHYFCLKPDVSVPCSIDSDGNEDCPEPPGDLVGECAPGEISCEDDDDCPGISTCIEDVSYQTSDCVAEEDGPPCEPVEEEVIVRTCGFEAPECEMNADCPAGLVCEQFTIRCPPRDAVACVDGQECPEPEEVECPDDTEGRCVLEEVPCESDDVCLDGWSCETIEITECDPAEPISVSGMSSSGSSGGAPDPAPAPEPEPADPEEGEDADDPDADQNREGVPPMPGEGGEGAADDDDNCETDTRRVCLPDGYEHYLRSPGGPGFSESSADRLSPNDSDDLAAAEPGGTEGQENVGNPDASAEASESDDDGCACSASNSGGASIFGFLCVLAGARVLRRRFR